MAVRLAEGEGPPTRNCTRISRPHICTRIESRRARGQPARGVGTVLITGVRIGSATSTGAATATSYQVGTSLPDRRCSQRTHRDTGRRSGGGGRRGRGSVSNRFCRLSRVERSVLSCPVRGSASPLLAVHHLAEHPTVHGLDGSQRCARRIAHREHVGQEPICGEAENFTGQFLICH